MRRLALLLVLVAIPVAGCGGDDGADEGAQATVETTATESAAQTIQVDAMDFMFMPEDLQAEPGEVTFELTNGGQAPHALEIEGEGVEEESDTIEGGESTSLTVELAEGTYRIYCPVGDHEERGMVGTLTVGAAAPATGGTTTDDDDGETHTDETHTGETDTGETETGDDDGSGGSGSGY